MKRESSLSFAFAGAGLAGTVNQDRAAYKVGKVDLALFDGPFDGDAQKAIVIFETKGFAQGLYYAPQQACDYAKNFPKCRVVFVSNGYCYKAFVRKDGCFSTDLLHAYLNIREPRDAYPLNPKVRGALEALRLLLEPVL